MRLGELLIAEGVITAGELREALDAQLISGGHLGTCLIELGYVREERLGQALARASGVPCAPLASFLDIPRFVLNALPQHVVQKHSTIPIRLTDGILDVAMIDPRNAHALEELRLASGHTIRSWIAPEVRIFQAMDRYYDVPRRIRYVTLCRTLDKGRPAAERTTAVNVDLAPGRWAVDSRCATGSAAVVLEGPAPSRGLAAVARAETDPLEAISALLCRAMTDDDIAELVLEAMHGEVPRRILFKVSGENARVWRSSGAELDPEAVGRVRFPILSEPIFGLLHGDDHYAGPLPSDPMNLGFYRKLGIDAPHQILLLPVHLDDQLIAMFYGDCGRLGTIDRNIERHRRLLAKAALAIDIVQTKLKIQAL
jgi:hypothetical protein